MRYRGRSALPVCSLLLLCALAAAACREAPAPFDAADRAGTDQTGLQRLTFSPGADRAPVWSVDGATILYTAERFEDAPRSAGVLLGIPAEGGIANAVFPGLQNPTAQIRHLVAPAVPAAPDRVAFFELGPLQSDNLCGEIGSSCDSGQAQAPLPPLVRADLRVRRLDAVGPITEDPGIRIEFAGRVFTTEERPLGLPGIHIVHLHPFQARFYEERAFGFRPTWAPDGRRVAFSDGLRLLIWDLAAAAAPLTVPGTEDAVWPAWSPDGEWIAFSRPARIDSTTTQCTHFGLLGPVCVQRRTEYGLSAPQLFLVRPDGSELRGLGPGEEPAWAPDGASLFFRRGNEIWRSAADGSAASAVPGTERGREPAVSPDGGRLAFSRPATGGDFDIWVVPLDPR